MKKNNSVLLSTPYIIWMVVFTLIPLGVVGYYALTDPATGALTLGNLKDLNMYWGVLWQSILYSLISAFILLRSASISEELSVISEKRSVRSLAPSPKCLLAPLI